MSLTVKAKIINLVYKNGDYRVFGCSPLEVYDTLELNDYYNFSIAGNLPFLDVDKEYTLEIEKSEKSRYKGSYIVVSVPSLETQNLHDLNREESFEILNQITTERLSNNILDAYPNFIELILTEGKQAIDVKNIHGVGDAYLSAYERELNAKYKYFSLVQKLKDYRIDVVDCKKLFDKFDTEENILKEIEENPYYVLMQAVGRSFDKTDNQVLRIRPELNNSEIRCEALIMDILTRNEIDSSTRINANEVWHICKEDYNAPTEWANVIKKIVTESSLIYYDEETKYMSKMETYTAELRIADFIKEKLKNSTELHIDVEKYRNIGDFSMTDMQLDCLRNFCKSGISVLSGTAGSGKTSSVKGLINLLEDNKMTYTLLSPTGKASRVLAESTNRKAMTIHKRCYQGEINSDVLVLDEATMVGLDTFSMLLDAISNDDCRIVLVGDPAQISSISLGKVFSDIIGSNKVPMTELTEIFRYKSDGSLYTATNIRQGKSFFDDKEMVKHDESTKTYSVGNNYKFIESSDEDAVNVFVNEYMKLVNRGIKPKDIMGLSPFNVRELGTYNLNRKIQEEVNPPKPNEVNMSRKVSDGTTMVFRVNDIVMNTKNDYNVTTYDGYKQMKEDKNNLISLDDVEKTAIMNGQVGKILNILENGIVVQFDEDVVYYDKSKLQNLLLSYVCSIHKSQGSSVNNVIAIIGEQHKKMLNRGLIYVADTRCRKTCINIGSIDAFNNSLSIVDKDLRDTWLYDLLIKENTTKEGEN